MINLIRDTVATAASVVSAYSFYHKGVLLNFSSYSLNLFGMDLSMSGFVLLMMSLPYVYSELSLVIKNKNLFSRWSYLAGFIALCGGFLHYGLLSNLVAKMVVMAPVIHIPIVILIVLPRLLMYYNKVLMLIDSKDAHNLITEYILFGLTLIFTLLLSQHLSYPILAVIILMLLPHLLVHFHDELSNDLDVSKDLARELSLSAELSSYMLSLVVLVDFLLPTYLMIASSVCLVCFCYLENSERSRRYSASSLGVDSSILKLFPKFIKLVQYVNLLKLVRKFDDAFNYFALFVHLACELILPAFMMYQADGQTLTYFKCIAMGSIEAICEFCQDAPSYLNASKNQVPVRINFASSQTRSVIVCAEMSFYRASLAHLASVFKSSFAAAAVYSLCSHSAARWCIGSLMGVMTYAIEVQVYKDALTGHACADHNHQLKPFEAVYNCCQNVNQVFGLKK